nr:MAG: ORF1 [Torque teno polar bear virus 22]
MPYRWRRWGRRRRRFPWRRNIFRYRNRWWRQRRWRPRHRRNPPVRAARPRNIRNLIIKGVELLGVQGSEVSFGYGRPQNQQTGTWTIDIKNVAPANKEVTYLSKLVLAPSETHNDCSDRFKNEDVSYWDLVGGFGQAHFSLQELIMRAILGFAKFSTTLERCHFIKFNGFQLTPMRAPSINYLFLAETHRNGLDYEKSLIHPVNLLCTPRTVIVNSIQRTKCCRNPKIRRKADPTIFGWHDLEDFMSQTLVSYVWTVFNPNNPAGRNSQITKFLKSPLQNHWMNDQKNKPLSDYCPPWANRVTYDKEFVDTVNNIQSKTTGRNWWDWTREEDVPNENNQVQCEYGKYSPFLPPMMVSNTPETLWFRYTFYFQIAGKSFGFQRQPWPIREADTCSFCIPKETCDSCIDPKTDLDKWGLLKKRAFQRITSSPNTRKRRALAILARHLRRHRQRKRKRVRFQDEEPQKRAKVTLRL